MNRLVILLFLTPCSVFASLTVTARGTGGNNSAGSTLTVTPASNLAAGSTAVLCLAADNANAGRPNVPASIVDSAGNTWFRKAHLGGPSPNTLPENSFYAAYLSTAFTTSDSLVITFVNFTTAKAWALWEIAPASGKLAIPKHAAMSKRMSTTGTPTLATAVNPSKNDAIIAMGGAESGDTWIGDSDTTNGSWSTKQSAGFGSGAAAMSVISQYKVVTAEGAQTYDPTLTSADVGLGYLIYQESDINAKGFNSSASTSSSTTATVQYPMTAGSFGVLCIAADNSVTGGNTLNFPSSFTDSVGNTWTLRLNSLYDNGTANAGAELAMYTATINATITTDVDTMTWTYTRAKVPNKVWAMWQFTPSPGNAFSYVAGAAGSGATTGTPTTTTSSITSGDTVIGMVASESSDTFTGDSDTSKGDWSLKLSGAQGSGAHGMAIITQYKTVTGAAAQTYNPTLTPADTIIGWIQIREGASSPIKTSR